MNNLIVTLMLILTPVASGQDFKSLPEYQQASISKFFLQSLKGGPEVVLFYAANCSSCKQVIQEFRAAQVKLKGLVHFVYINTDEDKGIKDAFKIRDGVLPYAYFALDRAPVSTIPPLIPAKDLVRLMARFLNVPYTDGSTNVRRKEVNSITEQERTTN